MKLLLENETGANTLIDHSLPQVEYDIGHTVGFQHPENKDLQLEGIIIGYRIDVQQIDDELDSNIIYYVQLNDTGETCEIMQDEIDYFYESE